MNQQQKLQAFVEMACYSSSDRWCDPGHPSNRQSAEEWMVLELGFLSKRDRQELQEAWNNAINDGSSTRQLFSVVKLLQYKYGE